ncbi:ribonuclease P protein subunit p30 isoform 1-T1 [Polymixia lowei]
MSVFMDLNISFTKDIKRLRNLIETAANLGFSTVAINYVYEPNLKDKRVIPKPMQVSALFNKLPVVQGKSRPITVLSRLTIMASDASHFRQNAAEFRFYDLLAVQPTSEKLFHAVCMMMDVDIICITVTEKLPFFFKRAPVKGAIERGLAFEISYSAAIRDSTMRRYTLANSACLMERCKGKNVIVSSGTDQPLELRGPYDISNLGLLFGLSEGDSKAAVSSTCRSVLLHAETRRTACGIIYTIQTPPESSHQQGHEAPPLDDNRPTSEGAEPPPDSEDLAMPPAAKRTKPAPI